MQRRAAMRPPRISLLWRETGDGVAILFLHSRSRGLSLSLENGTFYGTWHATRLDSPALTLFLFLLPPNKKNLVLVG